MQIFNFILWIFKVSFKITDDENTLTEDEFQDIIVNTEEEGIIDEEESDIIQAAVDFNDITVKSVYTPKEKIVSLDYSKLNKKQLLKQINNISYTRIPIYLFDKDNIIGILNTRKLLKVAMSSNKFTIKQALSEVVAMQFENRFNKDLPAEIKLDYERRVLLGVIDRTWINHIDAMQKLRNGIYLRAYAQRDPLQEYTEEAFYMFEQMTSSIAEDISRNIVHMGIRPGSEEEAEIPALKIELSFK